MAGLFEAWCDNALHSFCFTLTLLLCFTLQQDRGHVAASPASAPFPEHTQQPSLTSVVNSGMHQGWCRQLTRRQNVPPEDSRLETTTLPKYTAVPSDVPTGSEMREKFFNGWTEWLPHQLWDVKSVSIVNTTPMATPEAITPSGQDVITAWVSSLSSHTYSLPHRYRTLKPDDGQWPPQRVKDTTYTPFINHNTDFPGHTFTINGTISVATCAYGGQLQLLAEPTHALPSNHAVHSPSQTTITSFTQKQSTYPISALHQVPMHADWIDLGPNTYWQRELGDWRNVQVLEEEVLVDRQYTLSVPFVLVPRPIEKPLGGDWREYCYSTIVERYEEAAFLNLEDGILQDDDGYCWVFIDNAIYDGDLNGNLCLHRFLYPGCSGQVDESLGAQWNTFSGDWLEYNGRLEFWVCPSLEERERIGVTDAGGNSHLLGP